MKTVKNLAIAVIALAGTLAYAANSNYRVNLYRSTVVNGTELKAGEVKVEIRDNKAILKQGKTTAETDVKVETGAQKFLSTSVGYGSDSAANDLQEIRLGGTSTKLLFEQGHTGTK
ncbi:MAG: hypothetical protein M3Z32_05880 [Acidobacteriota bacterium]|nr:hypothetical protein [Acidobacteriota bacterium]